MHILMLASTVPASAEDQVPRFVLDQALAMAEADPEVQITLLVPHTPASRARAWPQTERPDGRVVQRRFGYAPRRFEDLTVGGIMSRIAGKRSRLLLVPLLIAASARATARVAQRERPDLIYAHWFTPQAFAAARASRRTGTPFGFTTHAADVAVWRRVGPIGRLVVRGITRRASFVTAVSSQTADKLLWFFRGDERERLESLLRILPMGVDVPKAAPAPGDPHHVAVVARLVEKKGIGVMLDAWARVVAEVPDARLTIGGDGSVAGRLRAYADGLGLDVAFPGFVTGAAKRAVLAAAGIVAVPSVVAADGDQDGLPVAALEGLALGRVVVASDASGAQDLIRDGREGFIVPAGDADALAAAIVRAMLLPPASRRAMIAAGRAVAETVSWPEVARAHLALMAPLTY